MRWFSLPPIEEQESRKGKEREGGRERKWHILQICSETLVWYEMTVHVILETHFDVVKIGKTLNN